MGHQAFTKQPAEQYSIAIEFMGKLPTGASLSSGLVSAKDLAGADVSATILGATMATIVGTQARVLVKNGLAGQVYKITFLVTLDTSDKLEEDVVMNVTEH